MGPAFELPIECWLLLYCTNMRYNGFAAKSPENADENGCVDLWLIMGGFGGKRYKI